MTFNRSGSGAVFVEPRVPLTLFTGVAIVQLLPPGVHDGARSWQRLDYADGRGAILDLVRWRAAGDLMRSSFLPATQASLDAGRIVDRRLVLLNFASGLYGFWSGLGPFTYNGVTYSAPARSSRWRACGRHRTCRPCR